MKRGGDQQKGDKTKWIGKPKEKKSKVSCSPDSVENKFKKKKKKTPRENWKRRPGIRNEVTQA